MFKIRETRPTAAFRESKPRSGNRELILIEAGWGSSGYYSEEVLSEYGPSAWPTGTHMHLDHPTLSEDVERPEGSTKDLIGVIDTTPRMAGIQLISEAKIFNHWKPVVDELAPHVGVSVVAPGTMEHGDAAGKHGPIVKEIHHNPVINRADLVTVAGAGGKLGTLIESARGAAGEELSDDDIEELLKEADVDRLQVFIAAATDLREAKLKESRSETSGGKPTKEQKMETDELQRKLSEAENKVTQLEGEKGDLETKLTEAEKERDEAKDGKERAEDALLISGASSVAREVANTIEGLPERAINRIVESAVRTLPKKEDGKLDEEQVRENAKKSARSELEYLAGQELEGELPIRESGGSTTIKTTTANSGGGDSTEKLEEAFQASGMSESAAKIAARGR